MLVSTTTELIEKLQDYERRNGVGAICSIDFYVNGNRMTLIVMILKIGMVVMSVPKKNLLKYPQLMTMFCFLT